jgi:bifunctional non-homologous end joining protein LigD
VVLNGDHTSDFSALQARLAGANQADLIYIAFDLLFFDGEDLRTQPLIARKQRLQSILEPLKKRGHIVYSDHVEGSGPAFFAEACKAGLEGIISKRADSQYRSGRVGEWLKVKCGRRQEFVIGGFVPPSTGQTGIGSLSVGYYRDGKLTYAGRVGTGFNGVISRQLRERLDELVRKTSPFAGRLPREATKDAVWVKPELVAEIAFTAFTADGNIRHGSFKGLREDKPSEEVVLEQPVAPASKGSSGKQRSEAEVQGVRISHPDRVVDEETGLTKLALAEYYADIAPWILPHLKDRPLSFVRCPEGVGAQCFYQRHIAAGMPSDVHPIRLTEKGKEESYLSINTLKGLLALVQFGALEFHPWGAPNADTDHPDRLIFDLDPDPAVPWARVVETAFEVRDRLKKRKLKSFVKTTGGKGLHIVGPLDGRQTWEVVKRFARDFAQAFADEKPDQFIAVMSKKDRKGKIFIDYLRNERSATAVSAYSTRARAGAPVATPLSWSELSSSIDPHSFTVQAVSQRLKASKKDPWDGFFKLKQKPT